MASNSPLYDQIQTTIQRFIASFATARTEGATAFNAALSPTCKRFYSPVSLAALLPPSFADGESNGHYATRMQVELDTTTQSREPEIRSLVIDEGARKAALNAVLYTQSKKTGKEYAFEFAFFLDFDEEGKMIERIQVFADSGMARKFFEEEQEVGESVKE